MQKFDLFHMENRQDTFNKNKNHDKGKPARIYTFKRKQVLITAIVVVFFIIALLIWKAIQINAIKDEYSQREQKLKQQTNAFLIETNKSFLKLLAKPYVWALRTELMQGNIQQIHLYDNDIVKEKKIVSVMVANAKGTIISSTNKKFEGQDFVTVNAPYYLYVDSTVAEKVNDSLLIMSSPIMSFNNRLGTLVVNYTLKTPRWLREQ